jgi:cell division protein FtsI/penicillin-binding protein 2
VLAKAGYLQVVRGDRTLIAGTLTLQADGKLRYQYNPRLEIVARQIPRGSVYDRNSIPLATSSWEELERHRKEYEQLGVEIDAVCSKRDERHYPFGGLTFHLLGDRRTRVNWAARNTSYVERDLSDRLIGYDDNASVVEVRKPNGEMNLAIQRDYTELIPLLRYRYRPGHESVQRILNRERNVRMSIDIALELRVAAILEEKIRQARKDRGAAVVMDAGTGDLLAAVSYPWPEDLHLLGAAAEEDDADEGAAGALYDRARWGIYPPGSTFKIVTAIAALRKNPRTITETFECKGLGGRQGNYVRGWGRPIYDDETDGASGHRSVNMEQGIIESCNAYFAQLAVERVGAESMFQTASLMEIEFTRGEAKAKMLETLRKDLPQAAFGQGIVYTTPFQMARVAATVATGGRMPIGRWITDDSNKRAQEPAQMLTRDQADFLGRAMRGVVLKGTAKRLSGSPIPIAGKTGTAENKPGQASHSWFIGFAPYSADARTRMAFSVIVENGGYGGSLAAPIAGEIAAAAFEKPAANNSAASIKASGKPASGGRHGNSR